MTNTHPTPAGWYPDATTPGQSRWWDGTQWTEHTQLPYDASNTAVVGLRAPQGTAPNTRQAWAIVAIFGLQLVAGLIYLLTFDWGGYATSSLNASADPMAQYAYLFDVGYLLQMVLSFLVYGATAALAYFDSKELRARGVQRPFPWALAFIPSYGSLVYIIGRTVVVRRRTGGGLAPLFAYIGLFVAGVIAYLIVGFAAFGAIFSELSSSYPSY